MEAHRQKADGRRLFTPQFVQEQVARLGRQGLTVSEPARELAMAPQLSDHGSIDTALDTLCTTERLGLVPITMPAAKSNSISEAFVNTIKRD
jgi:hypothetical protein